MSRSRDLANYSSLASLTGAQTFTNKTLISASANYALLLSPEEVVAISAISASATINFDILTQAILYYTSNASANFTLNFRGDSSTTLNNCLAIGQSITATFLNTNGATAYYPNVFQIDGSSITPKWSGGTAPSSGNASSINAYSFTIIKTANATFVALAGATRFA